jgi:predicted dehydrogenase
VNAEIRWGIVGPGRIAENLVKDFAVVDGTRVTAVASRSLDRAQAFAGRHGIERAYGSYAEILADPEVDVLYIATPHPQHHAIALAAIRAGKALLVEKAFTATTAGAQEVVDLARESGVFVMEAMWTRFQPAIVALRDLVADGAIGEVRSVQADLGVSRAYDPADRLFDLALGGGALLDLGVYPISFASMVLGDPESVLATSQFGDTGVEGQTAVVLQYGTGRQAVTTSTMQAWLVNRATIAGTDARIDIDGTWYRPTSFTLTERGGAVERHEFPEPGNGLRYQVEEVARCVAAGQLESGVMPLDESCRIMGTMDEVRTRIGLRYPGE